jgi:Helix-turn-helix domain
MKTQSANVPAGIPVVRPYTLEWLWFVRELEFDNPRAQHLALLHAAYANEEGICWPSVETLAARLGLKRSQTIKLRNELIAAGVLTRVTKGVGRGNSSRYKLSFPAPKTSDKTSDELSEKTSDGSGHEERQEDSLPRESHVSFGGNGWSGEGSPSLPDYSNDQNVHPVAQHVYRNESCGHCGGPGPIAKRHLGQPSALDVCDTCADEIAQRIADGMVSW